MKFKIKPKYSEIDKILRLENETWPEGTRAKKEDFESRIEKFPNGVIAALNENDLAGLTTSMIISLDSLESIQSWEQITDYGSIKSHNKNGNCLYVVSLGVSPKYQKLGVGNQLIKAQIKLARELELEYVVLGSRIPGFHQYNGEILKYLSQKNKEGFSIDPLVRFYQKCGLEIGPLKENYMENDKESRNFGLIMFKKL